LIDKIIGKKMIPHFSTTEECYLSQNNLIIKYNYKTGKKSKVCRIGNANLGFKGVVKEKILRNSLYRNYISSDFGINHVCVMNSSFLIAIYDRLYTFDLDNEFGVASHVEEFKKLNATPPLKSGIAAHEKSECFYFGEYINGKKEAVRIFRIKNRGTEIEVAYEFPLGDIQHVHGIFYDTYRNRLWVTTGDKDNECGIFFSDDEFTTLEKLGGGDQSWRAVSVIPTATDLFWGMDAGKDAPSSAINKIYKYNFDKSERTEEAIIGNPAYHSIISECGNIYLGVNFEPDRKQDTPEKSAIWRYNIDNSLWERQIEFSYKLGNLNGCSKYGYVFLSNGISPKNKLLYSVMNTTERKFATYLLKFD
jgi:hypothetical protein